MKETWGRSTGAVSSPSRSHMYRTKHQNHSLQTALTEYLIQITVYVKCAGRGTAEHSYLSNVLRNRTLTPWDRQVRNKKTDGRRSQENTSARCPLQLQSSLMTTTFGYLHLHQVIEDNNNNRSQTFTSKTFISTCLRYFYICLFLLRNKQSLWTKMIIVIHFTS